VRPRLVGPKPTFNIRFELPKSEMRINFQKLLPRLTILAATSQENQYRTRFESEQTGITEISESSKKELVVIQENPEPPKIKLGKRIKISTKIEVPTEKEVTSENEVTS
jgi:hypothetical protein